MPYFRPALERLGKPPPTYIEESRVADSKIGVVDQAEIAALRKELMQAKSRAKGAQQALRAVKVNSIDHANVIVLLASCRPR